MEINSCNLAHCWPAGKRRCWLFSTSKLVCQRFAISVVILLSLSVGLPNACCCCCFSSTMTMHAIVVEHFPSVDERIPEMCSIWYMQRTAIFDYYSICLTGPAILDLLKVIFSFQHICICRQIKRRMLLQECKSIMFLTASWKPSNDCPSVACSRPQ